MINSGENLFRLQLLNQSLVVLELEVLRRIYDKASAWHNSMTLIAIAPAAVRLQRSSKPAAVVSDKFATEKAYR